MTFDKPREEPAAEQTAETEPWVRPVLRPLGTMKELILGAGKTGSNLDQDPAGAFKPGIG